MRFHSSELRGSLTTSGLAARLACILTYEPLSELQGCPLAARAQRVSKRGRYKEGEGERHVHLWGIAGLSTGSHIALTYVYTSWESTKAYEVFTFPDGKHGRQEVTLWAAEECDPSVEPWPRLGANDRRWKECVHGNVFKHVHWSPGLAYKQEVQG